jgi:hypothetical protein
MSTDFTAFDQNADVEIGRAKLRKASVIAFGGLNFGEILVLTLGWLHEKH